MAEPTVFRKDISKIEVTKPGWNATLAQVEDVTNEYDFDYLTKQRVTIEEQKAREIAQRDKEIADVDILLGYFTTYPYVEPVSEYVPIAETTSTPSIGTRIWNGLTGLFS